MRITTLFALLLCAIASSLAAQSVDSQFVEESNRLDQEIRRYVDVEGRTQQAIQEFRRLTEAQGNAFNDPNAPLSELRTLESEIAIARDRLYRDLQDSATARGRIYDRMARLEELGGHMEQQAPAASSNSGNPSGTWQFRFNGVDLQSLVAVEFQPSGMNEGFVVVGTYRSSNGNQGTIRGRVEGSRMTLEVMHETQGKVATLEGAVGYEGRMQGTWKSLASRWDDSLPSAGTWTAQRVAD